MSTFRQLTHIGICVSDMERSKRFYRDVLGFRYVRELRLEGELSDTLLRQAVFAKDPDDLLVGLVLARPEGA